MKQLQVALELSEDDSVIRSVNRVSLTLQLLHSIMQRISGFFASGSHLRSTMTINDAPALAFSHATANLPALRDS
jgi:hypothetical protein